MLSADLLRSAAPAAKVSLREGFVHAAQPAGQAEQQSSHAAAGLLMPVSPASVFSLQGLAYTLHTKLAPAAQDNHPAVCVQALGLHGQ